MIKLSKSYSMPSPNTSLDFDEFNPVNYDPKVWARIAKEAGMKYAVMTAKHHDDFPHYRDRHHPMRDNLDYKNKNHYFEKYLEYMHGQVRELCTNYGKIDILWFDFSYDDMSGEQWRATELINMVRSLQPDAIIDNRLEASGQRMGSIRSKNPSVYAGDFASPEQIIPPEGITDEDGDPWGK